MTKLVCRLLGEDDRLLGWCEHQAAIRGDGMLRASSPVVIVPDETGESLWVSIHWVDINVATLVPTNRQPVQKGLSIQFFAAGTPMITAGYPPQKRLPPVTVGAVAVEVPVGALGAFNA